MSDTMAAANSGNADELLLAGVRVVDCSTHAAGPSVGAILGDLGADVVKVEEAAAGDPYRYVVSQAWFPDPATDGKFNASFELVNRNKRSIGLSLKTREGTEVLHRLIERADVFVTNKLESVAKDLGIEYERLSAINPRLVYVQISGYGSKGPQRSRPGFDLSAYWAASGQMGMLGKMLGVPPMNRPGMGDRATGMAAAGAVGLALFNRERSGKGQMIDMSLMHVGLWTVAVDIQRTAVHGAPGPYEKREEAQNPLWGAYPTKDGEWLILACLQQFDWGRICRALGHEELSDDPRYSTAEARKDNCRDLVVLLETIFRERTRDEWAVRLDEHRMNWSPVSLPEEIVASEQVRANEIFLDANHPKVGKYRLLRAPFTFSRTPARFRMSAPQLNEHGEEVLRELGYGNEDVRRILQSQQDLRAKSGTAR